jgi:glutathione reductase (NADPH)
MPSAEALPGVELAIDSNGVFQLEAVPERMLIVGAGYIAIEFAHVFAGLGSKVTLVCRGDTVLRGFDEDVRKAVHQGLEQSGVEVLSQTRVSALRKDLGPIEAELSTGGVRQADCVLMAVGRRPNTQGLGCALAGIRLGEEGEVVVDEWSRTNVPGIWAIGDVTNRVSLTPVAIREGHAFADTEFGGNPWKMDYENIPTAVFSQPEVGTVGLSETAARQLFGAVDIYRTDFRPMRNVISGAPARTFMKLVVRACDQVVVGVHVVGDDAAEMIQTAAIAVRMGATKQDFDRTCALHPSAAEELVTMRSKWVPSLP